MVTITRPSVEQFQGRILNCIPSRDVDKDWLFENALGASIVTEAPIPPALDLRAKWWPVGDQLKTGACVGWATADSVLRWHFVQIGRIAEDDRLSVRFVWMSAKETDEFVAAPTTFLDYAGTSLKAALDVARNYGVVTETVLPFDAGALYPDEPRTFYALASKLKIANYINLDRDPLAWRRWLAQNGPILTRLNVDDTWGAAAKNKGRLDVYKPETARSGHAIALVGYDETGFIVRNSWGQVWGDGGFAHASDAYALAAFTESYGVTVI